MEYWINVWQRTNSTRFGIVGDLISEALLDTEQLAVSEIASGYDGWAYVETIKRTETGVEIVYLDRLAEEENAG